MQHQKNKQKKPKQKTLLIITWVSSGYSTPV